MTQPKALIVDQITRVYKNAADRVIGIHCLTLHENREQSPLPTPGKISRTRFKRHAELKSEFDRFNLEMGESRIITKVLMFGKYDDYELNGSNNDIIIVRYLGNADTNTLEVSLSELPTVGDTL